VLYQQNHKYAALFIITSGLMFACMGACIKLLSNEVSNELIVFFRNLFGLLVLIPFLVKSGLSDLKTNRLRWHIMRSLMGLAAMYCFFYSIAHIPLSEAVLFNYTTPLFAPLIALFWLKEPLSRVLMLAIIVGFLGVSLLLQVDFSGFSWVGLIALASGFFAAIAMTVIRHLSSTEPTIRIVFYYGVVCTSVSTVPLFWINEWPTLSSLLILCAVGLFATLGQLSLTQGYAKASVAQVGPFIYSAVVFATLMGWFFWLEMPDMLSAVGIILVVAAGSIALTYGGRKQADVDKVSAG